MLNGAAQVVLGLQPFGSDSSSVKHWHVKQRPH